MEPMLAYAGLELHTHTHVFMDLKTKCVMSALCQNS